MAEPPSPDPRAAGDRREIRFVDAGGHRLRCSREGRGAPTFVCLHGLVDHLEVWDRLAPSLASRGCAVCIEQRGHGRSEAPPGPYTRADLARDVIAVLDALRVERALLVGHSMGGVVAMATALAYPERTSGLVLIGTASQCSARVASWYEQIAVAGERDGLEGLARAIYGPTSRRRIEGSVRGIIHMTRMLKSLHTDPLTPELDALACPSLLLVGEEDPMGPRASEILRDALPAGLARLETRPGRGHWLHVEAPDEVLRAIDAWRGAAAP